ncbi:MAG: HNH endonuclease [Alphaproteobacteria bacterium]|nr:MAG: HNH endonuclease [Alphaproteobacteria bacterium]
MPDADPPPNAATMPLCALCQRPIPPGVPADRHHLIPKLKGGRRGPVVTLHRMCHAEIHAALSEAELARDYASIEALRTHPRLARFIAWLAGKPAGFHVRSIGPRRRRR